MKNKGILFMISAVMMGLLLAAPLAIAGGYPTKDVKHIIPWSAGGGTDSAMRSVMHYAEAGLGKTIYNQNITGAQSGVGVLKLMNSRADGYTIGTLTWDSVVTVPYYKLVPGYDLKKLNFLCTVTLHPTALVVRADAPWKTLKDFIAAAKKDPDKLSISNVGTGGVWHLPALDMADKTGIKVRHVPYPKGSGPQREALLSGETNAACMSISAAYPALKAKKARILGVMAAERDHMVKDVPTFKELGYDVVWGSFRMVAIPKSAPAEAQKKLETAFAGVFKDPKFLKWANETGLGAVWMDSKKTSKFVNVIQAKAFKLIDDLIKKGILKKK
ncbi:MAG: tripartite tricarboxylate transporter substrate binding protein [Desulfarculaceae bacterium]|jgi:tripartite-type tricarboxylate transporter receptor subunit TctC